MTSLLPLLIACAAAPRPPDVSIEPGDSSLILTIPHGGGKRPEGIARRTWGARGNDHRTIDLGHHLVDALTEAQGASPHVVINHLARSRLDANRELEEAAQGDARAEAAWARYHRAIEDAVDRAVEAHGVAVVVDLHGHDHDIQRVELGYRLRASELALADDDLDADDALLERASIAALAEGTNRPLSDLIRGPASLGAALGRSGVPAVPSPDDPAPGGAPYWNGGYTTARYGVEGGTSVAAVQVECPRNARLDDDARVALGHALGIALADWVTRVGSPLRPAR